VKYVKNSFVPLRSFRTLTDANEQLTGWVLQEAGNRIHGTTRQKSLQMFAATEKHFLKPLPDVPVEIAVWTGSSITATATCSSSKPATRPPINWFTGS